MTNVLDIIKGTKAENRPYQSRIVSKTFDMFTGQYRNGAGELEPNARSVLIESPTGSGKTTMGWMAGSVLQAAYSDLVIGWVAMRRNLLTQAVVDRDKHAIKVRDVHMVSMFDSNPVELIKASESGRPVLMVVDEAQHDAANSMAHLHNLVKPRFILGLSATPFRTDRVKLCFDKIIKDAGIHQLIQDGYLSKFDHYTLPDWNVETVVSTYLREPERWGKSIFYFVNLDECRECVSLLRANGVVCELVTGDTDVESQLELFREGVVPVLVNCMKLTEGFDDPSLESVFVRDSGRGPTMQMCGRVLRQFPGLRKKIVQSKHSRWPFIRTAMPTCQYTLQEHEWLSLTVNPQLNAINQRARMVIAQTEVEMPEFVTSRAKKAVRKLRF